jgi:transmembrane sensor
MPENVPDIEDIAAEWAVKTDAERLEPGEQAALDAWLDADTRHLGAFARARAALAFANVGQIANGRELQGRSLQSSRRRIIVLGSLAACGAGILVAAPLLWRALQRESYTTQIGETKVVPLSDGSVVTLNTNSRVDVNYTKERRDIRLVRGEALFDVAHNKQRPFLVQAGDTQVRAVGTSFTVKLLPDQPVQVLVREGIVEIKRPEVPVAPVIRVAANTRAIAPVAAPIVSTSVAPAEVNRALAWRVGRLSFEGETLKEAVAEFARYTDTRIEIDAPDVENQTVAGLFVSNDPVGFAKAVAASFKLRMQVSDRKIRLSH